MQSVTKMYDVLKWLIPQILKFPRSYKFTLGDSQLVGWVEERNPTIKHNIFPIVEIIDNAISACKN